MLLWIVYPNLLSSATNLPSTQKAPGKPRAHSRKSKPHNHQDPFYILPFCSSFTQKAPGKPRAHSRNPKPLPPLTPPQKPQKRLDKTPDLYEYSTIGKTGIKNGHRRKEISYLTAQIIAYIGNKRKLLSLISEGIKHFYPESTEGLTFLDLFAGSGVVSRLAKTMGFSVHSNDWEDYSYIINRAYQTINNQELEKLFAPEGGLEKLLEDLNNLPEPKEEEQYIARYYGPRTKNIDQANFKEERLFYTRHNALKIDSIRNRIESLYPAGGGEETEKKRALLIALLLYQAATHTNTSGVFKACHKGFGGHGKDALSRILLPIALPYPYLTDSPDPCYVYKEDSNELIKSGRLPEVDVAYLDPPYNQHQYGSNYHLLNTIARWDKPPAPLELNGKRELKSKAGIRKDWIKTRSHYCYQKTAICAFEELIENLKAKQILISYSTDGIIPFDKMKEICGRKGKISIITNEYTKYPGGKQSNSRLINNIEFIITIDTTSPPSSEAFGEIDLVITRKKLSLMFKKKYSPLRIKERFTTVDGTGQLEYTGSTPPLRLTSHEGFELAPEDSTERLTLKELEELCGTLEYCLCRDKEEELTEILTHFKTNPKYFIRQIPEPLKKIAHKKYKTIFQSCLTKVKELKKLEPQLYAKIEKKILSIETIAEKRFNS